MAVLLTIAGLVPAIYFAVTLYHDDVLQAFLIGLSCSLGVFLVICCVLLAMGVDRFRRPPPPPAAASRVVHDSDWHPPAESTFDVYPPAFNEAVANKPPAFDFQQQQQLPPAYDPAMASEDRKRDSDDDSYDD